MQTQIIKLTKQTPVVELEVIKDTQFVVDFGNTFLGQAQNIQLIFAKEDVSAELIIPYILKPSDVLDLTTSSIHKVPHTSCITKVRGALQDCAKSNYVGKIIIEKSAHETNTFLQDDVLVLGEKTVNNSSPILQIDANDVKASHGATTGRINEQEIYYLMSRGLQRMEAEKLIVDGFFASLLSTINDDKISTELRGVLC